MDKYKGNLWFIKVFPLQHKQKNGLLQGKQVRAHFLSSYFLIVAPILNNMAT